MGDEPGFQVEYQSMDVGAGSLREQVTALGETRQALLARQVPGVAFGRVTASAQVAKNHADLIAENAGRLAAASGRLDTIVGGIGATSAAFRQWDAKKAKEQREQQVQLAKARPEEGGQRDKALATLRAIAEREPVSAAAVAKRPLESFMGWVSWSESLRNFQSGHIGDHYANEVNDLLGQPPTDANLRQLAEMETRFWNSERGSTVGGWASADWRYDMLVESRTEWLQEFDPAERASISEQLGLR